VWVHGYLLDTNIVAYWFDERRSEHQRVLQHIQELPDAAPLMISAITLGEIEYGRQVARIDALEQEAFRAFISTNVPMVLDITKATRIYYGLLRASVFEKYAPNPRRHESWVSRRTTSGLLRKPWNTIWSWSQMTTWTGFETSAKSYR
jgi:predicted nucleic acid-binding protein